MVSHCYCILGLHVITPLKILQNGPDFITKWVRITKWFVTHVSFCHVAAFAYVMVAVASFKGRTVGGAESKPQVQVRYQHSCEVAPFHATTT